MSELKLEESVRVLKTTRYKEKNQGSLALKRYYIIRMF